MNNNTTPNYKRIYMDMIAIKYPEKAPLCNHILNKKTMEIMDIILLDKIICGKKHETDLQFDQKLKSYDKKTIFEILDYQKKNRLNNSQLAKHFKLSRNTVAKWKKLFL
ncbi:helix-turn-helix domain-containing protein [uncultured Chryseobacterium sp.]|uniref:helix-turn-helix domain-containing protein n=1 Tax=uncultured Chryseobacterium sp. TaxID=259322 RepID=UPI0025E337FB|nr:helix-turn-helix domain-containing protein [uncultured Chryseobacterium sp.]